MFTSKVPVNPLSLFMVSVYMHSAKVTGEISLKGLLQIGFALNALSEFDALFAQKQYQSLDDVLNEQNVIRKRGKKNE